MAVEDASTGDVELVVDHCGAVMHPPLVQVLTLEEFVGFGIIGNHSPGISWKVDFNQPTSKSKWLYFLHFP